MAFMAPSTIPCTVRMESMYSTLTYVHTPVGIPRSAYAAIAADWHGIGSEVRWHLPSKTHDLRIARTSRRWLRYTHIHLVYISDWYIIEYSHTHVFGYIIWPCANMCACQSYCSGALLLHKKMPLNSSDISPLQCNILRPSLACECVCSVCAWVCVARDARLRKMHLRAWMTPCPKSTGIAQLSRVSVRVVLKTSN